MDWKVIRTYVERKVKESEVWEDFDIDEFIESLKEMIKRYEIKEKEINLTPDIIDKLMALELVCGMLGDLDEEKLREFDEAVRGNRKNW